MAVSLVLIGLGQLLVLGVGTTSGPARFLPGLLLAGVATGVLNAAMGRESVTSVPPGQAGLGSGANNTARYLGAAVGITLFVTVATHAGDDLFAGWNAAALVAAAVTLSGAAAIALTARQKNIPQGWTGGDRVAIHGTDSPSSIGKAVSHGCLRTAEDDLRWLLARIPLGSHVEIVA